MTTDIDALTRRAKLYKKIAAVTAAMKRVPKNGRNNFHNYSYATESDLTDAIRESLHENGLAFLPPSVIEHERIETGAKQGPLTRVHMRFALACTDTGETVESELWADGQDGADKGFYKAYTGGVKYFLMKTFLVSTGEDPEQDEQPRPAPVQAQQRPQPSRPQLPTEKANSTPQPPATPLEAKKRFYAKYRAEIARWAGVRDADVVWSDVQGYLGNDDLKEPTTIDEWYAVANQMKQPAQPAA